MDVLLDNLDLYGPGFLNTIKLFVFAGIGSLILGTLLAMLRVSPVPVFRVAGTTYVTLFRNTPLTLIFFFFAFAFPLLKVVDLSFFVSAVVALTLYTSAFVCEVVRAGINTVPVGQAEAARAVGLTFGQSLGNVVLPQAARSVVPPMMSTMIALLKNTTVAAGFSVVEAGAIQSYLSERGYSVLVGLLWVALGFVILIIPLTFLQRALEKRWSVAR
ncbi:amino acid ABC transporter permease [Prauserella marina]|uniref:Glutamate transport system permease protein n=1 Tax=Prauserella marina TaxID=530584 RepID=A0A222VU96_9PSEU|nr:amino acid ABC transporter permease [Prauserella marina]ASR37507.1 amino acid ABC transporter permease [Prauserella marina]PWV75395.1 amino acid ABC transporter membrane protein 1 (PAAT family) [Prauserella marina]SDD35571.1 glutamate transport system permease protein [Prauserella marina]